MPMKKKFLVLRNRATKQLLDRRGGPRLSTMPVFDVLDKRFENAKVGAKTTITQTRKNGMRFDYVYEKGARAYSLVERICRTPEGHVVHELIKPKVPAQSRRREHSAR